MQKIMNNELGNMLKNESVKSALRKVSKQLRIMNDPSKLISDESVTGVVVNDNVLNVVKEAVSDIKHVNTREAQQKRLLNLLKVIQRDGTSPYHLNIEMTEFKTIRRFTHKK